MFTFGQRAQLLKKALQARQERENIRKQMPASNPVGVDNLTHDALVEEIVSDFFEGLLEDGIITEDTMETESIYEVIEQMNIVTSALNEYFSFDPEDIFEED